MASPNSLPPGVDLSAALSSYLSSKPRPRVETFADASQAGELAGPDGRNMRRIYCPREGCGCLILRAGDAQWKEGVKGVYDSSGPFPEAPASMASSSSQTYWYVDSSPMGFENVGFSRNLPPSHILPDGLPTSLKYLICADCDLGPLGWTSDGSKEAWLGVERVRYGPVGA